MNLRNGCLLAHGSFQRCGNAPASLKPGMNAFIGYAGPSRPFSWCQRNPVVLQRVDPLLIAALFDRWSPAAIFRAVWAVIVVTFNAVALGRRFTHVGKEQFKATPSLANSNSSTAIAWVVLAFFAQAAPTHHCPSVVLLGCFAVVWVAGMAVDQVCRALRFGAQASAGLGMAISELVCRHDGCIAAGAKAFPINAALVWRAVGHEKATVGMAGSVNEGWHEQYPLAWAGNA